MKKLIGTFDGKMWIDVKTVDGFLVTEDTGNNPETVAAYKKVKWVDMDSKDISNIND